MKVKIIQASSPDCWYSDLIGKVAYVFGYENNPITWFTKSFYFFPQDIISTNESPDDILMPNTLEFGIA